MEIKYKLELHNFIETNLDVINYSFEKIEHPDSNAAKIT
jgi:hypothetical protein